jgi:hypothetical protein
MVLSVIAALALPLAAHAFPNLNKDYADAKEAGKNEPATKVTSGYKIEKYGAEWCPWCRYQGTMMDNYMEGLSSKQKPVYPREVITKLGGKSQALSYVEHDVDKENIDANAISGGSGIPFTIITAPNGMKKIHRGYMNIDTIKSEIAELEKQVNEAAAKEKEKGKKDAQKKDVSNSSDSKVTQDTPAKDPGAPSTASDDAGAPAQMPEQPKGTNSDPS